LNAGGTKLSFYAKLVGPAVNVLKLGGENTWGVTYCHNCVIVPELKFIAVYKHK
jgi:hypothetical protein